MNCIVKISSEPYTRIDNLTVRDPRISFRALGVLALVLSHSDGFKFNAETLARHRKEGRDAIRSAFRELELAGYVVRQKTQNDKGQWVTLSVFFDKPQKLTEDGFPVVGQPAAGFSVPIRNNNKNTNKKNNSPAPSARNTPEPPALGANPPPPAGECVELLFQNHEKWPDLIERVKEGSRGYFRRELANLKLRGGGTLTYQHADAVINYLISKGSPPLDLLKGILKRGGWDDRKLCDAALPGETASQAINRLRNEHDEESKIDTTSTMKPQPTSPLSATSKRNLEVGRRHIDRLRQDGIITNKKPKNTGECCN